MEYVKINGNLEARLTIENDEINISVNGNPPPLRVYGYTDNVPLYMGLLNPDVNSWSLTGKLKNPQKVILTEGVIDEEHNKVFEFPLRDELWHKFPEVPRKPTMAEEYLFSHPDTVKCIDYFGYYLMKDEGGIKTYAFPSDFYTHPLPHLMPYAYWYKTDLGQGEHGYFVISEIKNQWQFADRNVLTKQ